MQERTRAILETSLRDFIKTGEPITSERLYEYYDFGIKPAMLRHELALLGKEGYLSQAHPSGGRIPTNKAYRFFVTTLCEREEKETIARSTRARAEKFIDEAQEEFIKNISHYLNAFAYGYAYEEDEVYESGLSNLLNHFELEEKKALVDVVHSIEHFEKSFAVTKKQTENIYPWPQVFVGENPFIKNEHLSLIAGDIAKGDEAMWLCIIGPRRMDYEKALELFRSLHEEYIH